MGIVDTVFAGPVLCAILAGVITMLPEPAWTFSVNVSTILESIATSVAAWAGLNVCTAGGVESVRVNL